MSKIKKQDTTEGVVYTLFGPEKIKQEEVEVKQQFSPFKFTQDINYDKQYLFDETTQSHYSPWLINTSFSMFPDTLSHAVFLNSNAWMEKQMQHDYLFYAVTKRKRFKKDGWFKKNASEKDDENICPICYETFRINDTIILILHNIKTHDHNHQSEGTNMNEQNEHNEHNEQNLDNLIEDIFGGGKA